MDSYLKIVQARQLRLLLLTLIGMLTFSTFSPAAQLKVGDEYEGGKIVYIFQPGDKDFAETADQAVIVAKADVLANYTWSDTRSSIDKLEGLGSHDGNLPGHARQARLVRGGQFSVTRQGDVVLPK